MNLQHKLVYLGIDINDRYAMISYFKPNMTEPETVSLIAGSESYQVPLLLAKRRDIGQWYYGHEAQEMTSKSDMIFVDSLYKRAVNDENIVIEEQSYKACDLLALFLKKIILLPQVMGGYSDFDKLIITVDKLSKENMDMFWKILPKLEIAADKFIIIDHKESFYYFALSQQEDLWLHDVYLFEHEENNIKYYGLKRNLRTKPQVITIQENPRNNILGQKDTEFLSILQKAFENKIISTVYLIGPDFEGDWMKDSLKFLCKGRRAFMGNNLFSKGACYAALARDNEEIWPFIYMGENEMKFNLSLKVKDKGQLSFYNLVSAGKNWFEAQGECEVILSDTNEIDFWKQLPNSREAIIESLELTDLPLRPDRTTRVRISAKPISDEKIDIDIKDLGFGEIFRASDKSWHYTMNM